jgi:predicted small lipoprotein YifL
VIHSFGFRQLAVLGLAVLALGLAGCGRKGGLDLPPQAQAAVGAPPSDNAERLTQTPSATGQLGIFDPTDEEQRPAAAQGQKRRIFLDPLLD